MLEHITASLPQIIPPEQRHRLRQHLRRLTRPAWLGTLRRTTPLSDHWGFDRGTPLDRYYIERFLEKHCQDIRGRVLEVRDSRYTDRYGTGIQRRDVLDIDPKNPNATIVVDLATADTIPPDQFDCFVLTQTLQFIYDTRGAVAHAHRILRPGGVLLATVPAVSRLDRWCIDYWRFTAASCSALFGAIFGTEQVTVRSYGNVLTAMAFLTGMAYEELSSRELGVNDEYFPLIITVRAVKQCNSYREVSPAMRKATTAQAMDSSTAASLPSTSLIIPSRNRPELLHATVRSILEGDEIPTELIIVDQSDARHPTLTTLATDRTCEIRYLWTESVGVSRARNIGIAAAQHKILAFTDDDIVATSTWFGALIRALLCAGPRGVVSGRVLPSIVQKRGGFVPSTKTDENRSVYAGRVGEDVLYTNNAAMFRSAIDDVGNFDVRLGPGAPFSTAEDNDLGFRLLEAGYRICYVPEAVLYHRAWREERDYLPLRWSYGHGQGAYYAKHLSLTDRYMLWRMLGHVKNHAVGFIHRVGRQRRLAYGDAIYLLGFLYGAIRWLLTQRWARSSEDAHFTSLNRSSESSSSKKPASGVRTAG